MARRRTMSVEAGVIDFLEPYIDREPLFFLIVFTIASMASMVTVVYQRSREARRGPPGRGRDGAEEERP